MVKSQTNLSPALKERLTKILNSLGISEAEYLRGALIARMRRDARAEMKRQIELRDSEGSK